jgi:membrane protein DedA with SNARE-associated domain
MFINEQVLQSHILQVIRDTGDLGVFIGMFLESSIIPIPSEVIIMGAGAIGIPIVSIIIFGTLGATAGSLVGYALGRYAAMPVILKYGKFVLIKPHHIAKAEAFAKKHGPISVLIGRILPIVPFKVFSIAAGITRIPFVPFILWTIVGLVPRMILLSLFGAVIVKYMKPSLLILAGIAAMVLAVKLSHEFYKRNKTSKKPDNAA